MWTIYANNFSIKIISIDREKPGYYILIREIKSFPIVLYISRSVKPFQVFY